MKYDKKNELEWHRVVRLRPNDIVIFKQSLKEMVELTTWISERGAFQTEGIASEKTEKQEGAWLFYEQPEASVVRAE